MLNCNLSSLHVAMMSNPAGNTVAYCAVAVLYGGCTVPLMSNPAAPPARAALATRIPRTFRNPREALVLIRDAIAGGVNQLRSGVKKMLPCSHPLRQQTVLIHGIIESR